MKKFIEFPTVSVDIASPSMVEHFPSYLRMKVSEILEEVTGTQGASKMTAQHINEIVYKEQLNSARPDVSTGASHLRRDVACLGDISDGWSDTNVLAFVQLVDDLAMLVHAKIHRPPRNPPVLSDHSRIVTLGIAVVVESCWCRQMHWSWTTSCRSLLGADSLTQPPSTGTISRQGHGKPSQVARRLHYVMMLHTQFKAG